MHMTILRMLSTGSLAAFSANVMQVGLAQAHPVRAFGGQAQPQAAPPAPPSATPGTAMPAGRVLPRGSLLDLSV